MDSDDDSALSAERGIKRRKVEHVEEKKGEDDSPSEFTGRYPVGYKFVKTFRRLGRFIGEVTSQDPPFYHVYYKDDGDEEDLSEGELSAWPEAATLGKKKKTKNKPVTKKHPVKMKKEDTAPSFDCQEEGELPGSHKSTKRKKQPIISELPKSVDDGAEGTRSRRRAARMVVNYFEESGDEEEDDSDIDIKPTTKPKAKRSNSQPKTKKAGRGRADSSEDEYDMAKAASSDDSLELDCESSESDEESDEEPQPRKKKVTKKPASAKKEAKEEAPQGQPVKMKMCDMFQPMNTPTYMKLSLKEIYEQKEFLDPCGMEGTDDIIDRIVGEQVDRIGSLLKRSLQNKEFGSSANPLQLGTACSGTDAPSLALTLVQEQMELRGLGSLLNHTHVFSCENDPFKQAYLARNFSSELYPDIAKLTDDEPLDVYGQPKTIPPFNMFVAGTSCKNFSMLRSTRRLDIEDKGCSGETFLAATEVLFKEKPAMAIFENVQTAPWLKMQEYITGRVKLSECDSSKAIKEIKDKGKDLTFVLDEDGDIVVDRVPAVYGVRCGAVVSGFLRPGSSTLNEVRWPAQIQKKPCTLSDLIKANKISRENDTIVFQTECTYCTHIVKVDTKDFGLPQTRQRTYMFVWRPDDDDVNDDLGEYWKHIVERLKSPVRHALSSFILQVDHDIIRVFREALRGPPGRQAAREVFLEPDFWTSANANLPHNVNCRKSLGLQDRARFITQWEEYGKKQLPPHYWLEYLRCSEQRRTDLIDILHASAIRDAEAHDSSFSNFYWNLSQNASKEKHKSACAGIAGCITPGGDFFLPQEGRPLLGCEKLMIQGIPYFRLYLGNESEVQLGDLAGNAMSLSVVCATMLAAITCKQLRRDTLKSGRDAQTILSEGSCVKGYRKRSAWKEAAADDVTETTSSPGSSSASSFFMKLASLAPAAVKSSIWCTCETSGSNSLSNQFLQCRVCRMSCCRNCIGATVGYNLESHDTVDVEISEEDHSLAKFQSELRQMVPPILKFGKDGIKEVAEINDDKQRVSCLANYTFSLHRIKRERRKWLIIYYARDNRGIGEAVAEFRITVGELKREEIATCKKMPIEIGMKGELKSFFPALTDPVVYGPIDACAVVTVRLSDKTIRWEGNAQDTAFSSFSLAGEGSTPSFRTEVGLMDDVSNALVQATQQKTNTKVFKAAKERGEERRWLYPKLWKTWPEVIHLTAKSSASSTDQAKLSANRLCGIYERARCRQTTNQSALWIKKGDPKEQSLYIVISPNINRTGPDRVIVSSSIDGDASSTVAVLPMDYQPCDALNPKAHDVKNVKLKNWVPLTNMECMVPFSEITVDSPRGSSDVLVSVRGLSEDDITMLCRGNTSTEDHVRLDVIGGQKAQQTIRVFNAVCVAPILRHTAKIGLKYEVKADAPWTDLAPRNPLVPFGCCQSTIPARPVEDWFWNEERKIWDRRSEPGASRNYYLQLQAAPQPFELWVDRTARALTVKCFPEVVAHRAAGQLIEGRNGDNLKDEVTVCFRLSDLSQQSDPVVSPFKVSNCDAEKATLVELKAPHKLYERQQKVVTKMLAIEESKTEFHEIEMSEHEMPGSVGLSLMAMATRKTQICGGVIADAIGSGKTVVSIALILNGLKNARASRKLPNQSGATLVVVPPALIDQWESEIQKFTSSLKIVRVYDFGSLNKITLKEIIEADVVICPIDILEARGYLDRVVKAAKLTIKTLDLPKLPPFTGQTEQTGARGVWIPASSADPYAGGNNSNNQKRRNQSAYYTYTYDMAVQNLRKKEFKPLEKAVPLEFFEWERVIIDEIHESLCTTKAEISMAKEREEQNPGNTGFFTEKNRRAGRELLGITQKDLRRRPLLFRKAIFGLTGTPLLDSSSRVIELANLMGNTYIIGLASHWRKLERESCRNIFLHNYLEPKQSREVRKHIYSKCQEYVSVACCRNKTGEEMEGVELVNHRRVVKMLEEEKSLYLESQSGISRSKRSLAIKPDDFDVSAGHDISKFLRQNSKLESRGRELVRICQEILKRKGDEHTKILVFTDGRIGASAAARQFLDDSGLGCTWLDGDDSVATKNKKIAWYQTGDATPEDRARPRVLVLHFEHAAGLNLQTECHDLILFTPLYVGEGGSTSDPVSDASTELQAIGRVFRPGQTSHQVNVYRIQVSGPDGEECLDGHLIRRNTDEETIAMAVNAGE